MPGTVYITGDTHRDFRRISDFCFANKTSKSDVIIILGDAIINVFGGIDDELLKYELSYLPITIFCVHGNHENRATNIPTYNEIEFFGAPALAEKRFPNLIFALDGEIYKINGLDCLVCGGAYSVDRDLRLLLNRPWWPDEQPSSIIKHKVEKKLIDHRCSVDVILSHTCPLSYIPTDAFLDDVDQSKVDSSTELWFDSIRSRTEHKKWYCGHFHIDRVLPKMRFLFEDIDVFGV